MDETGWEPVLTEIKQAKVPVILVDSGVKVGDDSLYTTLIASDFVEEGRMAADWLAKKTSGKCNIAQLEGTPGTGIVGIAFNRSQIASVTNGAIGCSSRTIVSSAALSTPR